VRRRISSSDNAEFASSSRSPKEANQQLSAGQSHMVRMIVFNGKGQLWSINDCAYRVLWYDVAQLSADEQGLIDAD
jgi:hypothetical protein